MENRTRIELPSVVTQPYEVFVNGVPQVAGTDFDAVGSTLFFGRELAQEGRLGLWRWALIFFGVAGTYRKNDSVDIVFTRNGRPTVVSVAPIPPDVPAP